LAWPSADKSVDCHRRRPRARHARLDDPERPADGHRQRRADSRRPKTSAAWTLARSGTDLDGTTAV